VDIGYCLRDKLKIPSGLLYELCRSVHAEENAIINAARNGISVVGGTLYLYGEDIASDKIYPVPPCWRCKKAIINAGIVKVYVKEETGKKLYQVSSWIKDMKKDPDFYLKDQYEKIKKLSKSRPK
jgi:dCMP deaminase